MDGTATRPRELGFASAVLWVLALVLAAGAAVKVAMYGRFQEVSDRACAYGMDQEPAGGWSDNSFPCEQFGPMAWYLPYWASIVAYVVFAVLFAAAALLAGRARPAARGFALWTGITAVAFCALPGLLDLGRALGEVGTNQADKIVAARVFNTFPGWVEAVDTVVQLVVIAGAVTAVWLLSRPDVRAVLKRP